MTDTKQPPLLVVFPRSQLSAKDKERMTKHGILCVEADTPKDVVQLALVHPVHLATSLISGDAIITAALSSMDFGKNETIGGSITEAGRVKCKFVELLAKALGKLE